MPYRSSLVSPIGMVRYAMRLYRAEWRAFVAISLWFIIPLASIHFLTAIFYFGAWNIIFSAPFGVLLYILQLIVQAGMLVLVVRKAHRESISLREVFLQTVRIALSLLAVVALALLFVSVMAIGFLIPGTAVFGGIMNLHPLVRVVVIVIVSLPALGASVWFAFAPYVLVDKGERAMPALRISRDLVKHRFLAVAWRVFVSIIILLIPLTLVMIVVLVLIGTAFGVWDMGIGENAGSIWWVQIVSNAFAMLGAPLFVASFWRLYQDLTQDGR